MTTKEVTADDLKAAAAQKISAAVDLYRAALHLEDPENWYRQNTDPSDAPQWEKRKEILFREMQKPLQAIMQWDSFGLAPEGHEIYAGIVNDLRRTNCVRVQHDPTLEKKTVLIELRAIIDRIEASEYEPQRVQVDDDGIPF